MFDTTPPREGHGPALGDILGGALAGHRSAAHVKPMDALPASSPTAITRVSATVDLGELVRTGRKTLGLDQQSLADLAGVGRRFVSELENGKPTIEFGKVLTVTAALGIDLFAMKR